VRGIMKRYILVLIVMALPVMRLSAQTTNNPAGIEGSAAAEIRNELRREEERLATERKRIEDDLGTKERMLRQYEAESDEHLARVPELERARDEAEIALESSYAEMSRVKNEYDSLSLQEKARLTKKLISDLNQKYQNDHRDQLAAYKRDRAIIENYKWKMSDFDNLELAMPPDERGNKNKLTFKGRRAASGKFPTMDLNVGRLSWHKVPARARFSVTIVDGNPFVADVLIKPGFSVAEFATTNRAARSVHVFIAKHFEEKRRAIDGAYQLTAVSWFIDSGKSVCWQACMLPVFNPTPEPETVPLVATVSTPEIASVLNSWVWETEEWKQNAIDARDNYEQAKTELKNRNRSIPKAEAEVSIRVASLRAKQTELEVEIDELRSILTEYERQAKEDALEDDFDDEDVAPAEMGDDSGDFDFDSDDDDLSF
jgi:hypothetical protein